MQEIVLNLMAEGDLWIKEGLMDFIVNLEEAGVEGDLDLDQEIIIIPIGEDGEEKRWKKMGEVDHPVEIIIDTMEEKGKIQILGVMGKIPLEAKAEVGAGVKVEIKVGVEMGIEIGIEIKRDIEIKTRIKI